MIMLAKKLRETAGLTQQESADLLQIPIRTWQRWEEGSAKPNWASLEMYMLLTDQHPTHRLTKRRK